MGKPSQVVVLIEDNRQQQLLRRYLRRVGLETHTMRFLPPMASSGEQWVRERFPVELAAYRKRSAHVKTRLIAVIDADGFTLRERLAQLDQKLRENGVELIRTDAEQAAVARLIPRRNIETWVLCLSEVDVNEETDYKRTPNDWTALLGSAAATRFAWTRPNARIPGNCVPSLQHGVAELRRLDLSAL